LITWAKEVIDNLEQQGIGLFEIHIWPAAVEVFEVAYNVVEDIPTMLDDKVRIMKMIALTFKKGHALEQALDTMDKASKMQKHSFNLEKIVLKSSILISLGAWCYDVKSKEVRLRGQQYFSRASLLFTNHPGCSEGLDYLFKCLDKVLRAMQYNPEDGQVFMDKFPEVYSNSIRFKHKFPKGFGKHFEIFKNSKGNSDHLKKWIVSNHQK
jgi:hypothetical protein